MLGDNVYKHVPEQLLAGALKRGAHPPFDPLLCAYQYLFERLAIPRTGVLHLGGHIGQELPMYAALGFRRVVMVEPLEREFAQLQHRVDEFNATCGPIADFINEPVRPRAHAVRCAVSDRAGESSFCRTHMTSLSSLSKPVPENFVEQWKDALPLPWYKRPFGRLMTAWLCATALKYQEMKVPCQTLDGLVNGLPHGWKASDFSYLRMNIQGAELRALQGGAQTLKHVALVDLETNITHRYEDAPTKDAFDKLLSEHGLSCMFAYRIGGLGNLVYARLPGGGAGLSSALMEMPMSDVMIRLRRSYDAARMQAELRLLEDLQRVSAGYAGEANRAWESISLLAPGGRTRTGDGHQRLEDQATEEYAPTEALGRAPYLAELLDELACPKRLVRLLSLGPGGVITSHRDNFVSFAEGMLRLHIPVTTHPDVEFFIDGQRCNWKEGELWYGDFSRVHRAHNRSPITRIHLVIDLLINDFVLGLFPPEFVEAQRSRGIKLAGEAGHGRDQLQRFAFSFRLPAGFVPPGTSYEPLPAPVDGRVQLQDGTLIVMVNEQPLLRLEPTSGQTLAVQGLAPGTLMECDFDNGRVIAATLVSGVDGSRFHLQVQAS